MRRGVEAGRKFYGQGISPGVVSGRAVVLESGDPLVFKKEVSQPTVRREFERLRRALSQSKIQLHRIRERLAEALGHEHAYILDAQILMLQDKVLVREISRLIKRERVNAEWAVKKATDKLIQAYANLKDKFFRERGSDIEDVVNRIVMNLRGFRKSALPWPTRGSIIVAKDLSPSLLAALDYNKVKGFVLETGGDTSHTAILARSLAIPAIIHLEGITSKISSGEPLLMDGGEGYLIASPRTADRNQRRNTVATSQSEGPCVTLDGQKISVEANIEMVNQVLPAIKVGADGVGLFRSEFLLFQSRQGFLSEERQFKIYKHLAELVYPRSATIRTFDFGGDKEPNLYGGLRENNPALGLRGIRLSLQSEKIFRTQIRAILRASTFGNLKLVLPLISRTEEVVQAKQTILEVQGHLEKEGHRYNPELPLGVMIEVPAAVLLADCLSKMVDFFCIGTNDLIQYTLAVDRVDKNVCHLFEPFHPSVFQSILLVAKAARRQNIEVKVCGQAAANPIYALTLLGMGITSFSLNLNSIPVIKRLMRSVTLKSLIPIAKKVPHLSTGAEVEAYIAKRIEKTLQYS